MSSDDDSSIEVWVEGEVRMNIEEDERMNGQLMDYKEEEESEGSPVQQPELVAEDAVFEEHEYNNDHEGLDDNSCIRAKSAVLAFRAGLLLALKVLWRAFVAFSVWFTLRNAVCSLVMAENDRGCIVSLRDLFVTTCKEMLRTWKTQTCLSCYRSAWWNRISSMFSLDAFAWIALLSDRLCEFAKTLLSVACIYWTRFWFVRVYQLDPVGGVGDGNSEEEQGMTRLQNRLSRIVLHLKEESLDHWKDFCMYNLVVWLSAVLAAFLLTPLSLMSHLESLGDNALDDLVSWKSLAGWEYWKLFLVHFRISSFVADIVFNIGPLFDIPTASVPPEHALALYVGVSIAGTACFYPLAFILCWWWRGEIA